MLPGGGSVYLYEHLVLSERLSLVGIKPVGACEVLIKKLLKHWLLFD